MASVQLDIFLNSYSLCNIDLLFDKIYFLFTGSWALHSKVFNFDSSASFCQILLVWSFFMKSL